MYLFKLEATISVNLVGNVNVYATHMSYDRNVSFLFS